MHDKDPRDGTLTLPLLVKEGCGGLVTHWRTHPRICHAMSSAGYLQLRQLRSFSLTHFRTFDLDYMRILRPISTLLTLPSLQHADLAFWFVVRDTPDAVTEDMLTRAGLTHLMFRSIGAHHSTLRCLLELTPNLQLLQW